MKVVGSVAEMKRLRLGLPEPVGFVPTMGYLHDGHLELVRRAKAENQAVVVSIYVNPMQFGPKEDIARYPRDIPRDLAMLEKVNADAVFVPSDREMYPHGFSTWVDVEKVTERLEGESRPGHFRGVATVCAKLFNIIEPEKAYFGQKDAQQVSVIKRVVADLNMNLDIVVVPTIREPDGLAMSSRNTYLNPEERQAAVVLSRALKLAQKMWSQGESDAHRIRHAMSGSSEAGPLGGAGRAVEVDETYFGNLPAHKAPIRKSRTGRVAQGPSFKRGILSLVERGGEVRSFYVEGTKAEDVAKIVRENVAKESHLNTDEHRMYWKVGEDFASHDKVNHSKKEYGRYEGGREKGRLITTNTVESFFSVFKRGMRGVYQQCGEKHLHRYVAEFDFRHNARQSLGVTDQQRTSRAVMGGKGKRLTYETVA